MVTPNLLEAELLTGMRISDEDGMLTAARLIAAHGAALGAGQGRAPARPARSTCWSAANSEIRYPAERISSEHTHGTGCTLASAIASWLARGEDMPGAVKAAKEYVTGAIAGGFPLGRGIGPVDHAWQLRDLDRTGQRVILPALMQEVQTFSRRGVLPTTT